MNPYLTIKFSLASPLFLEALIVFITSSNIDKAFIDIKQIKKVFKDQCEEYQSDIPEYKNFIDNLKKTEQELRLSQNIAKKHSDEFSKTLETNNKKIKRLESIKNNKMNPLSRTN